MTSLWVIIRSEVVDFFPDEDVPPPTVCGIYSSREEAVGEILKLYIEDDIDLVYDPNSKDEVKPDNVIENKDLETKNEQNTVETKNTEPFDYRPTPDIVKEHRQRLLVDEFNTYTNRGNLYTLVECVLGAKHDFGDDVLGMYEASTK